MLAAAFEVRIRSVALELNNHPGKRLANGATLR
jgi:hypothetical protein